ncbi:MAG: hypothetical protein U1D30_15150 [Planctomycetota bacterium]
MDRIKSGARVPGTKVFGLRQVLQVGETVMPWVQDLRECCLQQRKLERILQAARKNANGAVVDRSMSLRDARIGLQVLLQEEVILRKDLSHAGVKVGDLAVGETLFPAMVDHRQAYFIWVLGETRPNAWRFRGEKHCHHIPERWFDGTSKTDSPPGSRTTTF